MKSAARRKGTCRQLPPTYSMGQAADLLGISYWKLSRLFRDGKLPEPPRVAGARILTEQDLARAQKLVTPPVTTKR